MPQVDDRRLRVAAKATERHSVGASLRHLHPLNLPSGGRNADRAAINIPTYLSGEHSKWEWERGTNHFGPVTTSSALGFSELEARWPSNLRIVFGLLECFHS